MPDNDDYDSDDTEESSVIRDLRKKAKRNEDMETENAALRTEVMLARSGLGDISPARQKALLAAHEGDTTREAIRKTAADLGFIAEEEPEPQVPASEQEAHRRAQEATAGAEASEAHPETLDDRIAKAKTEDELAQILADAGVNTNPVE